MFRPEETHQREEQSLSKENQLLGPTPSIAIHSAESRLHVTQVSVSLSRRVGQQKLQAGVCRTEPVEHGFTEFRNHIRRRDYRRSQGVASGLTSFERQPSTSRWTTSAVTKRQPASALCHSTKLLQGIFYVRRHWAL